MTQTMRKPPLLHPYLVTGMILGTMFGSLCVVAGQGCTKNQAPAPVAAVEAAVIDCAKAGVQTGVDELTPVVATILSGQAINWRPMLDGLAHSLGHEAVACTLAQLSQAPLSTTATRELKPPTSPSAQDRARTFIEEKGWTFANQ